MDNKPILNKNIEDAFASNKSKLDEAYDVIKQLILSNTLTPGTILVETQLSNLLNISRTPIRAALRELVNDKLVVNFLGRGMAVASITIDDVVEIYEIREVLDVLALRLFLRNVSPVQIEELKEHANQMQKALENKDFPLFIQHDMEFHDCYLNNTGNARLASIVKSLHDQIRRFLSLAGYDEIKCRISLEDHRKVMAAIESGDYKQAEIYLNEHITKSRDYHISKLTKKQY